MMNMKRLPMRGIQAGFLALLILGHAGIGARQDAPPAPPPTVIRDQAAESMLLGSHLFSCQWISWEEFGRAEVKEEDGTLRLTAVQRRRDGDDYVEVEGVILEVLAKSFTFRGSVVTRVSHINSGRPCRREGTMTFRISGLRRY